MLKYLITILIFLSIPHALFTKESPDMIVVLSRHGAREALSNEWGTEWEVPAYIMDTGVEQHFTLGAILAQEYAELLKDIRISEIYLQSSIRARTQMSVAAELLGLFANTTHATHERRDFVIPYEKKELVNKVIDGFLSHPQTVPSRMQLISQKVLSMDDEDLIGFGPWNCHVLETGQNGRIGDKYVMEKFNSLSDTVKELQRLGFNVETEEDMRNLGDDLQSRYYHNEPAFEGVPYGGKVYNDTVFFFIWWSVYNLVGTEIERSARVFPMYTRLIEWFTAKATGKNPLKIALLGGHETSLFPILNLHKITNHTCFDANYQAEKAGRPLPFPDCTTPDFGSQITYEFYNNSGNPYIKMLYNGKQFKLCEGTEGMDCPLNQFIKELPSFTSGFTESKWQHICHPTSIISSSTLFYILPIITCLAGYLIGMSRLPSLLKKLISSKRSANEEVKHIPLEDMVTPHENERASNHHYKEEGTQNSI